jgi:hypothetical protein
VQHRVGVSRKLMISLILFPLMGAAGCSGFSPENQAPGIHPRHESSPADLAAPLPLPGALPDPAPPGGSSQLTPTGPDAEHPRGEGKPGTSPDQASGPGPLNGTRPRGSGRTVPGAKDADRPGQDMPGGPVPGRHSAHSAPYHGGHYVPVQGERPAPRRRHGSRGRHAAGRRLPVHVPQHVADKGFRMSGWCHEARAVASPEIVSMCHQAYG